MSRDRPTLKLPIIRLPAPKWAIGGHEQRTIFYQNVFVAFVTSGELARFIVDVLNQHEANRHPSL